MNEQYYLNEGQCCIQITSRYHNYLEKNKYLSEFSTETDKQIARHNLGIDELFNYLISILNAKVIERGGVAWDLAPTEGNVDKVLSSNAIYNTLLNYALKSELDNDIQQIWNNTISKINETYNKVEEELNELKDYLISYADDIRCEFDGLQNSVNQSLSSIREEINSFKDEVQTSIETLIQRVDTNINDLLQQVNTRCEDLVNEVNTIKNNLIETVNSTLQNYSEYFNTEINSLNNRVNNSISQLTNQFNQLQNQVNKLETNLYSRLYRQLSDKLYSPLEKKVNELAQLVRSFIRTSGGTALSNQFGDDELIGVNQKALTQALNKIWEKLENITGEASQGITMIVSPTYFIGEDECLVNISASSTDAGIFEHIEFYANGVLIDQADNVETFNCSTTISDTTDIKCVAKILGISYEKTKTVTHYNSFFLLAGKFNYDEDLMEYLTNHPEYARSLNNGLRNNYDVECEDGDHIIVVMGRSLANGFMRADLNGLEIPFNSENITYNGEEFTIFTSVNKYTGGIYNIDING